MSCRVVLRCVYAVAVAATTNALVLAKEVRRCLGEVLPRRGNGVGVDDVAHGCDECDEEKVVGKGEVEGEGSVCVHGSLVSSPCRRCSLSL